MSKKDFEMLATKNTYIQSAYKTLQVISQDDEKRLEYEAREKAVRDYNQRIPEAEQRGEGRGRETIAHNLLAIGLDKETIAKATGLSITELDTLSNK